MLNSITLMGRLTKEPDFRTTQSGTNVVSFTLAVDRDYQSGGSEKQTDFIDCTAWRNTAEFVSKYFRKGQMMALRGSLQSRKWEDKNGNSRVSWEVLADSVYFCGDKKSDGNVERPAKTGVNVSAFEDLDDESDGQLPF